MKQRAAATGTLGIVGRLVTAHKYLFRSLFYSKYKYPENKNNLDLTQL